MLLWKCPQEFIPLKLWMKYNSFSCRSINTGTATMNVIFYEIFTLLLSKSSSLSLKIERIIKQKYFSLICKCIYEAKTSWALKWNPGPSNCKVGRPLTMNAFVFWFNTLSYWKHTRRNIRGSKPGWESAFLIGSPHFLLENDGIVVNSNLCLDKTYPEMLFCPWKLLELMPTCLTYGTSFPDCFRETDFSIAYELRSVFIRIVLLYAGF
jgi:hypothetical protein